MYGILLVDDERWVRTSLRRVVGQTGLPFEVRHECANGLEAMDWLEANGADLVLADIKMPVMDGMALAERLKGRCDVVIVSGHDDFPLVQKALRSGVRDYLLKPVEAEEMQVCLNRWVESRAAAPQPGPPPGERICTSCPRSSRCCGLSTSHFPATLRCRRWPHAFT
ncbi:response regulator [Paenibacillus sp. P26]|nr:response regulator [Paenibacillus sp. P26]UUZ90575.1 response regulator [Paenibacillus sp. P25]